MQRLLQRLLRCSLAGVALFGGLWLAPSTAHAVDSCSPMVLDMHEKVEDKVLDSAVFQDEIDELTAMSADVRIRAFEYAPEGSFDAYLESRIRVCPDWANPDDNRLKDNMVVIMFSTNLADRQLLIYYGGDWQDELEGPLPDIYGGMVQKFQSGDFNGGVKQALSDIHDEMQPFAWGTLVRWVLIALIVIVLVGAAAWVIWLKKKEKEAKLAASTVVEEAAKAMEAIADTRDTELSVTVACGELDDDLETELTQLWEKAQTEMNKAIVKQGAFGEDPRNKLHNARNRGDYERITVNYRELLALATAGGEALAEVNAKLDEISQMIEDLPQLLPSQRKSATELRQQYDLLRTEGYKLPGISEDLDRLDMLIAKAYDESEKLGPGEALGEMRKSALLITQIGNTLTRIPQLRQELEVRQVDLSQKLLLRTNAISKSQTALAELTSLCDPACTSDLQSLSEKSFGLINPAAAMIEAAVKQSRMNVQEWDAAKELLDAVDGLFATIQQNCTAIAERKQEIASLRANLPGRVTALVREIGQAHSTAGSLQGDQFGNQSALDNLKGEAQSLQNALSANRPNYLDISTSVEDLDRQRREILERAKREDADERQRQSDAAALLVAQQQRQQQNNLGGGDGGGSHGGQAGGKSGHW